MKKEDVKQMLKDNYRILYSPMPTEIKEMFPIVTPEIASEYFGLHFTVNHTGKMSGMISLSTTCKATVSEDGVRNLCPSRIENAIKFVVPGFNYETATKEEIKKAKKATRDYIKNNPLSEDLTICAFCFSDTLQDAKKGITPCLKRNFEILNNGIVHMDWLPVFNARFARGESFGDFASSNAVINYCNLCNKNPWTSIAVWTKNPGFFFLAFKKVCKPCNMIIVLSSEKVNRKTRIDPRFTWFIDKVFTVYTDKFARENNININCGARACMGCLNCYRNNSVHEISELLK